MTGFLILGSFRIVLSNFLFEDHIKSQQDLMSLNIFENIWSELKKNKKTTKV